MIFICVKELTHIAIHSRPVDGHVRDDRRNRAPKISRPPIFYSLILLASSGSVTTLIFFAPAA
jgi:hypothetical protein